MRFLNQQKPRGLDPAGFGYYGAKRGTRKHKGFDLLADPDELVFCPIAGQITKIGWPYQRSKELRYIEIANDVYRVRIMYIKPDTAVGINMRIFPGEQLGKAQNVAGYWGGNMMNHIHVEIYKNGLLTDPEPLISDLIK